MQKRVEEKIEDTIDEVLRKFKGWIMQCEGRVMERLPEVLDCFFDNHGEEVFASYATFCNPATALLATRLQEAYDSFKELVEENLDFSPTETEQQSLLMAILSEQFNLIVMIWSLHKVLRVVLALPVQPYKMYNSPLSVALRKPIVQISTLKLVLICLVCLNFEVLFEGSEYFDTLSQAVSYFNSDPCNVLPSFNRERANLVNATCYEVMGDAEVYTRLQYKIQEQYFQASLYKGCFLDDWDSFSVYGDCPLCQYNNKDFVLCNNCTHNATTVTSINVTADLEPSLVTLREASNLMRSLFKGRCTPEVFDTFFLDTSNKTRYRHTGFELLFLTGWLPQVFLPIFLLKVIFETFAMRWPSSIHSSTVELTNEDFEINKQDEDFLREFIRQRHVLPHVCSILQLFALLVLIIYTQGLALEDPAEAISAYSYLPPLTIDKSAVTEDKMEQRLNEELARLRTEESEVAGMMFCYGVVPEIVPPVSGPIKAIEASSSAICALTYFGQSICFGEVTRLYHRSSRPLDLRPPPQTLPSLYPRGAGAFKALAVGATFTCGLLESSSLALCYGFNVPGSVSASSRDELNLERSGSLSPFRDIEFEAISSGDRHFCGLTMPGRMLLCYGYWAQGNNLRPASVEAHGNVTAVASTMNAMCIIDSSYTIRCWNYANQGGAGKVMLDLPTSTMFSSNYTVAHIDASHDRFCVYAATDVSCWHESLSQAPAHEAFSKTMNGFIFDAPQGKYIYLFKDGSMTDAPVRAPPISRVVSTGRTHCGIFY